MNKKNIVLIIVLVVALGAIVYFFTSNNSSAPTTLPTSTNPSPQQPVVPTDSNPVTPTISSSGANDRSVILSELQRLNIEVTGASKQIELELPSVLSDANWGLKKIICEEGGYNLSAYAGKTILFTSYPINEVWNNTEPLNVWVATSEDKIVCVYKAVRENSMVAPGIFSIKENSNIKKK